MGNDGDGHGTRRAARGQHPHPSSSAPTQQKAPDREEGSRAGAERKSRRMLEGAPPGVDEAAPPWMLEGAPPGVVKCVVRDGSGEGRVHRRSEAQAKRPREVQRGKRVGDEKIKGGHGFNNNRLRVSNAQPVSVADPSTNHTASRISKHIKWPRI